MERHTGNDVRQAPQRALDLRHLARVLGDEVAVHAQPPRRLREHRARACALAPRRRLVHFGVVFCPDLLSARGCPVWELGVCWLGEGGDGGMVGWARVFVVGWRTEAVACEVPREVWTRVVVRVMYLCMQSSWGGYASIECDVTDDIELSRGAQGIYRSAIAIAGEDGHNCTPF